MEQQVVFRTREMQAIEAQWGRPMDGILRDLYIEQKLTLEEVGVKIGQTKGTVSRWLERFGIPARRSGQRPGVVA